MNIADKILNEIIKQGMVRADPQNPSLLIWNANTQEQIEAVVAENSAADTALLDWFEANVEEFRFEYKTAFGLRSNSAFTCFRQVVAAARRKQEEIAHHSISEGT